MTGAGGEAASASRPGGDGLSADAVVRLRLVIGRLNRQMSRASGGQDLTVAQLSALVRVEQHGPLRLGELAAREAVAVPSMVRTIAPLTADGLIAKSPDPTDGRSQLLELTPAGLETITRIRRERSALLAHRSARLTAQQCRDLEAALPLLELLLDEPEAACPSAVPPPRDRDASGS
ncbi:DNA-binding MarR family transcriptional regulator [Kitasatospora sp. MAA19]|uniref:MarR family winged helix-turn-helix transcriptional regulator n=1 Tax=Kitasatospora sp. MAA19 TaxID=3035090 RepID=UPI002475FCF6|nr:MarR family transcriptional regulator [Kitasatospora sp. MAA19]MDH6707615.1 DNA-binding MarR family transcriptional regulator [Kitasatospora sp. MAA19]